MTMRKFHRSALMGGAAGLALLASATATWAQSAPDPAQEATEIDDVVVVGSNILGAKVNTALPVVVVNEEQILATGAVNGDDLLRSIPQMGDVLFSAANNPQTSNAARGDVNSVNLRSLGVGNTLVLLNGRRIITHPTSGRKALYVNPSFTTRFDGWTREESLPLLQYLYAQAIAQDNVCTLQWKPGSVAIWDNRASWHFAKNDYHGHRREMHRITLAGDVPA
jgi:outer membrane receptor protein involved in Fe transport